MVARRTARVLANGPAGAELAVTVIDAGNGPVKAHARLSRRLQWKSTFSGGVRAI
jgi:hypothetical protein